VSFTYLTTGRWPHGLGLKVLTTVKQLLARKVAGIQVNSSSFYHRS
jgi:hypothetical protein